MAKKKVNQKTASKKKINKKKVKKKAVVKKNTTKKKAAKKKITKKKMAKKKAVKKSSIKKTSTKKKAVAKKTTSKVYKGVQEGSKIKSFSLPYTGGGDIDDKTLVGQRVVLFFYPKDATPGCTLEGHDFTRLNAKFKALNTLVLGVSRDSMKSHNKFKEKQNYSVNLISDENEKLCRMFDVVHKKKLYGREFEGIERSTFVLDEKGVLKKSWRKVKVPGHAEEVLAYIKEHLA